VVELGDVASAQGEHQRVLTGLAGLPPVLNELLAQLPGALGDDDAVVLDVGLRPSLGVAVAEVGQGVAVPLVGLTMHVAQLDRLDALGDGAKGAAGLDLGELAVVADKHELGISPGGVLGEVCEGTGADHAGLIDDQPPRDPTCIFWG